MNQAAVNPGRHHGAAGGLTVVKYGGHAMTDPAAQRAFAVEMRELVSQGCPIAIVHGGGPQVNAMLDRLGIESEFVAGQRATSAAAMDVVRMVLVGQVRSELVGLLNDVGVPTVGLSGEDAGLLIAEQFRPLINGEHVDIGQVGEVTEVRPAVVQDLLAAGYLPVISTIARGRDGRPYNVNADIAAGALAGALAADRLIVLTDVAGVYRAWPDESTLIAETTATELRELLPSLAAGMIPKVQGCLAAVDAGVPVTHVIDGRVAGATTSIVRGGRLGTAIVDDSPVDRRSDDTAVSLESSRSRP